MRLHASRRPRWGRRRGDDALPSLATSPANRCDGGPSNAAHATLRSGAIKLHHLRYVIGAAEHGSFRRAAGALAVQQSTISRRVRELEDRLGASIFERGPTGVQLTKAGVQFLDGAQGAMTHLAHAVDRVGVFAQAERNIVRIGILAPLTPGFLDDLLRGAVGKSPPWQLSLTEAPHCDLIAALQAGRLDIAFLTGAPSVARCRVRPLWTERLVAALPVGHRLAVKTAVTWLDLIEERFLMSAAPSAVDIEDLMIRRFRRLGRSPSILRQAVGRDTLLRLVAMDQGLAVIVESAIARDHAGVVYRPISREIASFSATWSPLNGKPAVRRLIALAERLADRSRLAHAD